MTEVRVVGRRSRRQRCVVCHDDLSGKVLKCSQCSTLGHVDCMKGLERCPTLGCERKPKPKVQAEAPADAASTRFVEEWLEERRNRRPGLLARFGPYLRLILSGVAFTLMFLILTALALFPILVPKAVIFVITAPAEGVRPDGSGMLFRGSLLLAMWAANVFGVVKCFSAIRSVLPVLREVHDLLERDRPVPMTLWTRSESDSEGTDWFAELRGEVGELTLHLGGTLPPGWLVRDLERTAVLVYGWPPPGPYLIEFPDGKLALVHPEGKL